MYRYINILYIMTYLLARMSSHICIYINKQQNKEVSNLFLAEKNSLKRVWEDLAYASIMLYPFA